MDQNTGAAGTQADPATQPQAGATQTAQAASAEPEATDTTETMSFEEARKLRRENSTLRKRAEEIERERTTAAQAGMSEQERLTTREADVGRREAALLERERETELKSVISDLAVKVGFADPRVAYRMIDRNAVEWTEDGRPRNVERLLGDVLREYPLLTSPSRTATVTKGVQSSGTGAGDWNSTLRRIAGVTPD